MTKLKIITIVGTRPELIRLCLVINKLDLYCDHLLVHTGQNFDFELNEIFFRDLRIRKPDYFLNAAGETAAETIGSIISKMDVLLESERPDAVLVLGDTNSCLSVIPAKRRKIPIFHMEAGNRCYDYRVPEEINRKIVDHTADVNLTYSDIAREALLKEGLPSDFVINCGSPMYEVLNYFSEEISNSSILAEMSLLPEKYFLCSLHREENVDDKDILSSYVDMLNNLTIQYSVPVVLSAHPRTRNKIQKWDLKFNDNVRVLKPLGFFDYVKLQLSAKVVLSDSGTISEESSILNFPALNLRVTQERHEAFKEASVMFVGNNMDRVNQALSILGDQGRGKERTLRLVTDYDVPNVSDKVIRIIHSYTDYVNQFIWRKK